MNCDLCESPVEAPMPSGVPALDRMMARARDAGELPTICRACSDHRERVHTLALDVCVGLRCRSARRRPPLRLEIPDGYQAVNLDGYDPTRGDRQALSACRTWLIRRGGRGLYLHGRTGAGKSHLAYSIANALRGEVVNTADPEQWTVEVPPGLRVEVGQEVRRIAGDSIRITTGDIIACAWADVLREMKRRFRDDSGEEVIRALRDCDVLILDDMGTERASEWATEQLFAVLENRVANRRPLIITSNYSPTELASRGVREGKDGGGYSLAMVERLASRLAGACEVVEVKASDYRVENSNQTEEK